MTDDNEPPHFSCRQVAANVIPPDPQASVGQFSFRCFRFWYGIQIDQYALSSLLLYFLWLLLWCVFNSQRNHSLNWFYFVILGYGKRWKKNLCICELKTMFCLVRQKKIASQYTAFHNNIMAEADIIYAFDTVSGILYSLRKDHKPCLWYEPISDLFFCAWQTSYWVWTVDPAFRAQDRQRVRKHSYNFYVVALTSHFLSKTTTELLKFYLITGVL